MEPTLSVNGKYGSLKVWKDAVAGEMTIKELRKGIPWKRHVVHGHFDRMIWRQRAGEDQPDVFSRIESKVQGVVGQSLPNENYANLYEDGERHIFFHRDTNANPGECVTLVSFGVERKLTFVNHQTGRFYVLPMSDGTILQFDCKWNANHYHKVLKEEEAGPRVSMQWYRPRDETIWKKKKHKAIKKLWDSNGPSTTHVNRYRREMKKMEPWNPDQQVKSGKRARDLIPKKLIASLKRRK